MTQSYTSFDFSQIGKRTPYRVPDGFLAENEQQLLTQFAERPAKRSVPLRRWLGYAAAASVALVLILYPIASRTASKGQIYAPQEDWTQFAEADLFLENMDW